MKNFSEVSFFTQESNVTKLGILLSFTSIDTNARLTSMSGVKCSYAIMMLFLAASVMSCGKENPSEQTPFEVSAWTFGDSSSLNAATKQSAIDEVSVDWYQSRLDASLQKVDEDLDFADKAREKGLKVFATIANYNENTGDFDSSIPTQILDTEILLEEHLSAIVKLCNDNSFDGIDIDWEKIEETKRDQFSAFIAELSSRLHDDGKELSIAIHAKTEEPGDWSGAIAQDWAALGLAVDEFKIMTYDYSYSGSDPGPIAPPDWTNEVVTFAKTLVDPAKIMVGIPFYGYDWVGSSATDLDWTDSLDLLETFDSDVSRDDSEEAKFTYEDNEGLEHTVYYQDIQALTAKLDLLALNHPDIRGIAIWRMGGEDPKFWEKIKTWKSQVQ